MARFRRWAAVAVAIAVVGYMAYAVVRGVGETGAELAAFAWWIYAPVLVLTLVNYSLRFAKWQYLLRRLDVQMPVVTNAWVFTAGLAMVISPGKAGELLKPYLVRVVTGAPMQRTIPALVAERVTDGLAVVLLAALGVSTFYAEGTTLIATTLGVAALGLVALSIKPLSLTVLDLVAKVPVIGKVAPPLREAYLALRTCLAPVPLALTLAASLVAWGAECVGYWLVFRGLAVDAPLDASTFLYAFATVFGAPSPGGMGMADVALVEGSLALIDPLTGGQAVAAALLIRIATLWFGVLLGAGALLRMDKVLARAASR